MSDDYLLLLLVVLPLPRCHTQIDDQANGVEFCFLFGIHKGEVSTISAHVSMESRYWIFKVTLVLNSGGLEASEDVPSGPITVACSEEDMMLSGHVSDVDMWPRRFVPISATDFAKG